VLRSEMEGCRVDDVVRPRIEKSHSKRHVLVDCPLCQAVN